MDILRGRVVCVFCGSCSGGTLRFRVVGGDILRCRVVGVF